MIQEIQTTIKCTDGFLHCKKNIISQYSSTKCNGYFSLEHDAMVCKKHPAEDSPKIVIVTNKQLNFLFS